MTASRADTHRAHQGTPVGGIQVSWSTSAGCPRPAAEAQQAALELARRVEASTRLREPLGLQLSACAGGCVGAHVGDIGLRLHGASDHAPESATVDLLFNGEAGLTRAVAEVPFAEVAQRLVRLLRAYTVEGCGRDTFASWSRGLRDQDLRTRLGISEPTVFAAGREAAHSCETLSTR